MTGTSAARHQIAASSELQEAAQMQAFVRVQENRTFFDAAEAYGIRFAEKQRKSGA
jgi:hypothetical protein